MIDYGLFCQTIADWRAGRRPSVPMPTDAEPSAAPSVDPSVVEMGSGLIALEGADQEDGTPSEFPVYTPDGTQQLDTSAPDETDDDTWG